MKLTTRLSILAHSAFKIPYKRSGGIGIHIEANSEGYSRDKALEAAMRYNASIATVVNDPILCQMLLAVDIIPIHRINRNGLLDDNQQQYKTTRLYIQTAAIEVPDPRCIIYWNNEPGRADLKNIVEQGLIAIDEANKLGRILCMLNWSYGNPEDEDTATLAPLYRAAAAGGHYIGFHEGTDINHPTLEDCYPDLIGRFLKVKNEFGFEVIVTEFAASKDAHNGYATWDSHFGRESEKAQAQVYSPNGVRMTPFTAFKWKNGFAYILDLVLQSVWKSANERHPVMTSHNWGNKKSGKVSSTANINVRPLPDEKSTPILGVLKNGDTVQYWDSPYPSPNGAKYLWFKVLFNGQESYVAQVANLSFLPVTEPSEKRISFTEAEVEAMYQKMFSIKDSADALRDLLDKGTPFDSGDSF